MSTENTVNSQIVDSVSAASTLLVGQGPAQSFSMLDMVLLETLGTGMHNAVARQQGASMVSNAAVTAACAKMINAPWPVPPPAPEPPPPPPPQVIPLPGPVPAPPFACGRHRRGHRRRKDRHQRPAGTDPRCHCRCCGRQRQSAHARAACRQRHGARARSCARLHAWSGSSSGSRPGFRARLHSAPVRRRR